MAKKTNTEPTMTERFSALAEKSANEAVRAGEACVAFCESGNARGAKRAKRDCATWLERTKEDAMRAQGAEAQATGQLDAPTPERANVAWAKASRALSDATEAYRALKLPGLAS